MASVPLAHLSVNTLGLTVKFQWGIKKVTRNFLRFKTIKSAKTNATPRPIVDSSISVVSMVTMVFYTIAGRDVASDGISEAVRCNSSR